MSFARATTLAMSAVVLFACGGRASRSVPAQDGGLPSSTDASVITILDAGSPSCPTGASRCKGAQPQTCTDGTWADDGAPCVGGAPACMSGTCVMEPPEGLPDATSPSAEAAAPDSAAMQTGFDAAILDGALPDSAASPIATFEFIAGGVVQQPMSCAPYNWMYQGIVGQAEPNVFIRNTGAVPIAYIAAPLWSVGGMYRPGVPEPAPTLAGMLAPGQSVEITTAYEGGYTALLGASVPFSTGVASADEGDILWPDGVPNGTNATIMHVAQIYVSPSCTITGSMW